MTRWQRVGSGYLFVITEGLAWFIVLRVIGTAIERGRLDPLAFELERALRLGQFQDQVRAQAALELLRDGIAAASGGPPLIVVLAGAVGAYMFSRWLARQELPRGLRVGLGLVATLVALQILLHVAIAGDPYIWDNAGLGSFLDSPRSSLGGEQDAAAFVDDPDLGLVTGASLTITVVGTFALWLRFLVAGRDEPHFEQVLRSFSFGFVGVLVGVVGANAVGAGMVGGLALPYFVLAMLSLAVAHAARAGGDTEQGLSRDAPWAVSVITTLGVLAVVALLFGALAALEVQRAFAPVGEGLLTVIEFLFILVLRPIFFVVNGLMRLILGEPDLDVFDRAAELLNSAAPDETDGERTSRLPGWIFDAGRILLVTIVGYLFYRLGRLVFVRAGRRRTEQYEELREGGAGAGGLTGLVRKLMPRRRPQPERDDWLRRHAVYELFARMVLDARDRGLERLPGDTPVRFATQAARRLDAPPFAPIAEAFDRARYGRHYPPDDALQPLALELGAWELAHPAVGAEEQRAAEAAAASAASAEADERHREVPRDLPPGF